MSHKKYMVSQSPNKTKPNQNPNPNPTKTPLSLGFLGIFHGQSHRIMRVIDLPVSTSRPSCCKIDGSHLAAGEEEIEVIAIGMIRWVSSPMARIRDGINPTHFRAELSILHFNHYYSGSFTRLLFQFNFFNSR